MDCRSSSSPSEVEATTFSIRMRVMAIFILFKTVYKEAGPPPEPHFPAP